LIQKIHSAPRAPGVDQIYLPGEIEHLEERKRKTGGIPLPQAVYQDLLEIGRILNIDTEELE